MKLLVGRKYHLTCDIGGKVTKYHAEVIGVDSVEYRFRFTTLQYPEATERVFDLSYDIQNVEHNLDEGSWMMYKLKAPDILDEELFTL